MLLSKINWPTSTSEAKAEQIRLRDQLVLRDDFGPVRFVAGADIAIERGGVYGIAGVILFRFPELDEVERVWARGKLALPYIPGLLSFREGPILCEAFAKLQQQPDLTLFDGQGIAHPRGIGLASHMGLLLDCPAIGCAKSRLVGAFEEPPPEAGSHTPLYYNDKVVGAVIRTRDRVKPIFVSPGHRISPESAVQIALQCCDGFRIPKPTREADKWVATLKGTSPNL